MKDLLFVFLGGGLGSTLRYLCSQFIPSNADGTSFPWATFCVNILGCFLIGLLGSMTAKFGWSASARLFLTVGLCGGFTTFSTFCRESFTLLDAGNYLVLSLYISLSIILGILAVWIGSHL